MAGTLETAASAASQVLSTKRIVPVSVETDGDIHGPEPPGTASHLQVQSNASLGMLET